MFKTVDEDEYANIVSGRRQDDFVENDGVCRTLSWRPPHTERASFSFFWMLYLVPQCRIAFRWQICPWPDQCFSDGQREQATTWATRMMARRRGTGPASPAPSIRTS